MRPSWLVTIVLLSVLCVALASRVRHKHGRIRKTDRALSTDSARNSTHRQEFLADISGNRRLVPQRSRVMTPAPLIPPYDYVRACRNQTVQPLMLCLLVYPDSNVVSEWFCMYPSPLSLQALHFTYEYQRFESEVEMPH